MAILNDNKFLAPTGVGLFGGRGYMDDSVQTFPILTAVNVAGWIPGVSLIAGVASIILACSTKHSQPKAALMIRGIIQCAQVGIILAPFDIVFSFVRAVREHLKHRVDDIADLS